MPWLARNLPWFVGVVAAWKVAVAFGLDNAIKSVASKVGETLLAGLGERLVGIPIFHAATIRRYQRRVLSEYDHLKLPFEPRGIPRLAELYVAVRVENDGATTSATDILKRFPTVMITGAPGSGKSVLLEPRHVT